MREKTKYSKDIIKRLKDSEKWPGFEKPDFLQNLNEVADNSFNKRTVEGCLASLLIYHQLVEELIKIIIECSTFYIQLRVFPQEYSKKKIKGKMFGQLINELKHSVNDNKTKELIEQAQLLNNIRIKMVHKITLKSSLTDIKKQCKKVKDLFDSIFKLFEEICDNYRVTFKDIKKYPEKLEELNEEE